jgi:hypothetical protein
MSHHAFQSEVDATDAFQKRLLAGGIPQQAAIPARDKDRSDEPNSELIRMQFSPDVELPDSGRTVTLHLRDIAFELHVLDVAIGDDQIGLLLPMNVKIQSMKIRTKLILEVGETGEEKQKHSVMYLGGNLVFQLRRCELRVLSFCRLTD